MDVASLSDEALLAALSETVVSERRLVARVVAYLVEVEERRLDLKSACSSLFDFCTRRLGMSDGEAFRRITAARLVKRYPSLLGSLSRGEVHLSALVLLRDYLTESNYVELIGAASGKSKREVQELLAARFPRPDVPTLLQELPSAAPVAPVASVAPVAPASNGGRAGDEPPVTKSRLEPLSEARFYLQLSIHRELRDKIERAVRLMRHQNPKGDLAVTLERGVDLLIAKLEKDRLGLTQRPRKACGAKSGYVTRAARRAVYARDGEQCTFVSKDGERCPARAFLEIDHIHARALAGSGDISNLRHFCRAHNALHAEQTFGREHIERKIASRRRGAAARRARAELSAQPALQNGAIVPGSSDESPSRRASDDAVDGLPGRAGSRGNILGDSIAAGVYLAGEPGHGIECAGAECAGAGRRADSASDSRHADEAGDAAAGQAPLGRDSRHAAESDETGRESRGACIPEPAVGGDLAAIESGKLSRAVLARAIDDVTGEIAPAHLLQRNKGGKKASLVPELPEPFVLASRGLTGMGFRSNEVRGVMETLRDRFARANVAIPAVDRILREALAVLC